MNEREELSMRKGKKMIKLKDFSAKLHKYFSKTFGVVNLNVENTYTHTHIHAMCSTNTRLTVGMLLFVCRVIRGTLFRYFHVIFYISFEKIVQVSCWTNKIQKRPTFKESKSGNGAKNKILCNNNTQNDFMNVKQWQNIFDAYVCACLLWSNALYLKLFG